MKDKEIRSFLDEHAGRRCKKRPTSNIKQIKDDFERTGLNKEENLIMIKGLLNQGIADRGAYDAFVSLIALIISVVSLFLGKYPIEWIALAVAVGAFVFWLYNQLGTQYYAEMYEVVCGLEKHDFFKKDGKNKENEVAK